MLPINPEDFNLNHKYAAAVELLLAHPDTVVAEMLGIRLATLRRWMRNPAFSQILRERELEQRSGAVRIARQAVVNAAAKLAGAVGGAEKPDPKVLLDVLKAAGAFDPEQADPAQALAEFVSRLDGEHTDGQ